MNWGRWNHFSVERAKPAFLEKVKPDARSGCHIWLGATNAYGRYGSVGFMGKPRLAHRVAWFLFKGTDPGELCVCHHCDNGLCVNPEHLFLGTQKDNVLDMERKKRSNHLKGDRCAASKLTSADIFVIRSLKRDGMSVTDIARRFPKVTVGAISHIFNKRAWKGVGLAA